MLLGVKELIDTHRVGQYKKSFVKQEKSRCAEKL